VGETYVQFSLRAERSRLGNGRTYAARYVVADTSGHAKTVLSLVTVPHDLNGVTDPLTIRLSETSSGTRVDWDPVPGAACYDVAVGDLATLRGFNSGAGLELAACAGSQILQPEIEIDLGTPVPGSGYYFMVDYVTAAGQRSGYGSESGPFDLEPILPRLLCP